KWKRAKTSWKSFCTTQGLSFDRDYEEKGPKIAVENEKKRKREVKKSDKENEERLKKLGKRDSVYRCPGCNTDLDQLDDERKFTCEGCDNEFCDLCKQTKFEKKLADPEDKYSWAWFCGECKNAE